MSSSALPITPQRFAEAILDLPLPTLHLKAAEIRNSISHLESSNSQLQTFADEGDKDCEDALKENKETMLRMEERILMLKHEAERRGFQLMDHVAQERSNGHAESRRGAENGMESSRSNVNVVATPNRTSAVGSLGDAALMVRRTERVEESEEEGDDGVYI